MSEGTPPRGDVPEEPRRGQDDPAAPASPPPPGGGWGSPTPPVPPQGGGWGGEPGAGTPPSPPAGWQGQQGQGWQGQGWGQQPPGGYPPPGGHRPQDSGLAENVASGLAYVLTWVTGLIFFFTDRRPEVRFHAMQAILFGAAWTLLGILNRAIASTSVSLLLGLVWFVFLILWVVLMIQAFSGKHFKLPVIGDLAEQQATRQG